MYHLNLGEKLQSMIFFSFSEQYQREYHCYSKCLALFCLETLDLQRQLSLTPAGQSVSQYVDGWVRVGWGEGVSTECLFAVVPCVWSGSPTVQHFLLGFRLTLPQSGKIAALSRLASCIPLPHAASLLATPPHPPPHLTLLSSCPLPHLSVVWHKDHFSWKM